MPRPTGVNTGLTLAEVLVASLLALLGLGLVIQFSQTVYRISNEEFERTGVEKVLITLTSKIQDDLSEASAAGITLSTSGHDFLIHPVTLSDVGTVVYQDQLILWHLNTEFKVLFRQVAESYPGRPFDGTPLRAEETALIGMHERKEFRLSGRYPHISEFTVVNPGDVQLPFVGSPLTLKIVADLEQAKTRKTIEIERVIQLRNSGA